jgi:hypothetical protein
MLNFNEIKFEYFWNKLFELLTTIHDFETIDQNKKFEARNAIQAIVIIPRQSPSKGVCIFITAIN